MQDIANKLQIKMTISDFQILWNYKPNLLAIKEKNKIGFTDPVYLPPV